LLFIIPSFPSSSLPGGGDRWTQKVNTLNTDSNLKIEVYLLETDSSFWSLVLQLPDFYYNVMTMTGKVARYMIEVGPLAPMTGCAIGFKHRN
jgi:hypothetical protein